MHERVRSREQKRLHPLLCGTVLFCAGHVVVADWLPPDLSNTRIRAIVEYQSEAKIYRYEYEISHPATNRGTLSYFSLATDIPFPYGEHIDKGLLERFGMKGEIDRRCDSPLASGAASVVCADPAPGWGVANLNKGVIWTAIPGWRKQPANTTAGRVISGFTLYTRVPPGAVMATLAPNVDTGPDSPYQRYGQRCEEEEGLCPDLRSFNQHYSTVGPVALKE